MENLADNLLGAKTVEIFRIGEFSRHGRDFGELVTLITTYHRLPSYVRGYEFEAAPLFDDRAGIRIKRRYQPTEP